MMSPDSIPASPDDNQISGGGSKTAPPLKCPRCDSPNTKFCYYNNYSLTQPRHFCKTCRRYWTKGGALRNVPIGGGCRKNKKTKSASRLSSSDLKDSATSSHSGGFKFFQGLSPSIDFQLGSGGNGGFPFNHHLSSSAAVTANNPSCFDMGFNLSSFPIGMGEGGFKSDGGGIREMGSMNVHSSLASSIESLSCINQDLHWKLQQQRLAMLFGGETHKDGEGVSVSALPVPEIQTQKPQPISFQNLGFFENSYTPTSSITTTTNNNNSGSNENDNTSNWHGNIQAWTDLHHYSALP
ncbi:hypothetical protein NE237_016798 [Protea cynaroides]|uniref:Dof zinc finger protein n=1 Tax=Protea cynaroides TaxID=273540 RepID=A0A9Q0HFG8_9MAGN|nr:hypothetical protein NE237_016798 [Protea cynaroides]